MNLTGKLNEAYRENSILLGELRHKYKAICVTEGEESLSARNLRKEITDLTAKINI